MGKYDFDKIINRQGTGSVKWDKQDSFGVQNGLLPFWVADTDYASLPEITQSLQKRLQRPEIGYTAASEGCFEVIQNWFGRRYQWQIPFEHMRLTIGVVPAIHFSVQALTSPGDKVLTFTPVYDPLFTLIRRSGRIFVDCPLEEKENSYYIDFSAFEAQLKAGVKAVIFCNPHNPVGRVWSRQEMERLAALCAAYDVYLLCDEIHGDITLFGRQYTPAGCIPQIRNKLISYTAISKTFNMAGLSSCCVMIADEEIRAKFDKALADAWIPEPNALAYPAIIAAYTHGDDWVNSQNEYLSANVRFATDFLREHLAQVGVTKTEGTYLMWLDFRYLGLSSKEISDILVQKYGLAVGLGSRYGAQADGFMRLNVACPRTMLEHGMERLREFAEAHNR